MSLVNINEEMEETVYILSTNHGNGVDAEGEPTAKRIKLEEGEIDSQQSIKQILFNINKTICLRLDSIESKLEILSTRTKNLEDIVADLKTSVRNSGLIDDETAGSSPLQRKSGGAVIVGLPHNRGSSPSSSAAAAERGLPNLGPNVTLITLNSEEDYPSGSWLGDEHNPEMRVRVPISPSDLLHIHSNCRTPEKMALTLLDYLFDRETQAISNLSGTGKHGKRQLDPLMVYGMRCHLIHRFAITENDWHRIKLNIDSKCRTAFRRRNRGLPLTVKGFRSLPGSRPLSMSGVDLGDQSDDSLQHGELHITGDEINHLDLSAVTGLNTAQLIQNAASGEIQVLHATPEQVAALQQTHQIQILQGDQVLGQLQNGELTAETIQVAVSLPSNDVIAGDNDDNTGGNLHISGTTENTIHIDTSTGSDGEKEAEEVVLCKLQDEGELDDSSQG